MHLAQDGADDAGGGSEALEAAASALIAPGDAPSHRVALPPSVRQLRTQATQEALQIILGLEEVCGGFIRMPSDSFRCLLMPSDAFGCFLTGGAASGVEACPRHPRPTRRAAALSAREAPGRPVRPLPEARHRLPRTGAVRRAAHAAHANGDARGARDQHSGDCTRLHLNGT